MRRLLIALILVFSVVVLVIGDQPGHAATAGQAAASTDLSASSSDAFTPPTAMSDQPRRQLSEYPRAGKPISIIVFLIIIAITAGVVYMAARRTKTSADFYVAHSAITGTQNGWALAGDYMSAASFLGIAGLISLYGYDGFMYSVGWLVAYVTILLLVAEPCRNAGKYTVGDILAFRSFAIPVRSVGAVATVTVSTFYLIAQMVGAAS